MSEDMLYNDERNYYVLYTYNYQHLHTTFLVTLEILKRFEQCIPELVLENCQLNTHGCMAS